MVDHLVDMQACRHSCDFVSRGPSHKGRGLRTRLVDSFVPRLLEEGKECLGSTTYMWHLEHRNHIEIELVTSIRGECMCDDISSLVQYSTY